MSVLAPLVIFVSAYFFTLLLVALIMHIEMKKAKKFKEWEENKLMLTFLLIQAFLMVLTILYLAISKPGFLTWAIFVIINVIAFFLAFTESIYRKNYLAAAASFIAFIVLITLGL